MKPDRSVIARRRAAHPKRGRFDSSGLREEFTTAAFDLRHTFKLKRFGIFGGREISCNQRLN